MTRMKKKRASMVLVGVVLMAGCFEEDEPFFESFLESTGSEGTSEDCDPYFGDCEDGEGHPPTFDGGMPLDAGWIDTGCEDEEGGETPPMEQPPFPAEPPCDPYDEDCTPEPEPDPEPDPEPEPDCDPYTGACEPEPDPEPEAPENCDPYIDDCSPPVN